MDIINDHIPIFRYENTKIPNVLTIVPIVVAIILILLLPIASNEKDKGACIYWNRQKGAKTFI